MKKIISFSLYLLFISLNPSNAEDITLRCSTWSPFVDVKLPENGFYSQIITEAGKRVDLNITTRIMPWKRVITLAKSGDIDGVSCPIVTEERRQWFAFTDQDFYKTEIGFFTLKDNPISWRKTEDLQNKSIGVLAASTNQKYLQSKNLKTLHYADLDTGLKMLAGQRFDALYDVKTAISYILSTKHAELAKKITYAGTLQSVAHRPAISLKKENAIEIAKRLSEGYRLIKADGTLDKILKQASIQ